MPKTYKTIKIINKVQRVVVYYKISLSSFCYPYEILGIYCHFSNKSRFLYWRYNSSLSHHTPKKDPHRRQPSSGNSTTVHFIWALIALELINVSWMRREACLQLASQPNRWTLINRLHFLLMATGPEGRCQNAFLLSPNTNNYSLINQLNHGLRSLSDKPIGDGP